MSRSWGVELLDAVASEGGGTVTAAGVRDRLGLSPQAASNLLKRLARDGFVERVRRGEYLVHPFGELGVSAVAADRLDEAIVVVVGTRAHRICYRTALHEHGLLTRPGRTIQVAVDRRLHIETLAGQRLESIIERPERIGIDAVAFGSALISSVERALVESAHEPRRVGGIATVAEAFAASTIDPARLETVSSMLNTAVGLRRLAALDRALGLGKLGDITLPVRVGRPLPLDPTDPRHDGPTDDVGVVWPCEPAELLAVVTQ